MHRVIGFICALVLMAPGLGRAQTAEPEVILPGYLLVVGRATDRSKIGSYAAALPPIYASHRAYYLAIGGASRGVTWLEGPLSDRSVVIGKFPSRAEIDRFWWGEPYRTAIKKRDNAGVFSVVALEASIPTPFEGLGTGFMIVMTGPRDNSPAQLALSARAAAALHDSVVSSGGVIMTKNDKNNFTSLEGDSVFDRIAIVAWPTLAARDAYLISHAGRRAASIRQRLGVSVVGIINGIPKQ